MLDKSAKRREKIMVELSESELRYLLASGYGLLLNIPKESLSTYTNFNASEIGEFSKKIRRVMDENDISV
ncbi:hypothetical protein [Photobacterium sp. Hal280]|uniref:hypothetical protein n=1 Tax=Photobacterium sp. Hal280 TaxID=3035163 RepID=UPI00301B72B9